MPSWGSYFCWADLLKRILISLFVWLISHQPAVLFSQNKSATSNQPTVLFSQNKPAPAINHQLNEHAAGIRETMNSAPFRCPKGVRPTTLTRQGAPSELSYHQLMQRFYVVPPHRCFHNGSPITLSIKTAWGGLR
jgi:hypothetical protein